MDMGGDLVLEKGRVTPGCGEDLLVLCSPSKGILPGHAWLTLWSGKLSRIKAAHEENFTP